MGLPQQLCVPQATCVLVTCPLCLYYSFYSFQQPCLAFFCRNLKGCFSMLLISTSKVQSFPVGNERKKSFILNESQEHSVASSKARLKCIQKSSDTAIANQNWCHIEHTVFICEIFAYKCAWWTSITAASEFTMLHVWVYALGKARCIKWPLMVTHHSIQPELPSLHLSHSLSELGDCY